MLSTIPSHLLELYEPLSLWESFYLSTRWRLCPFDLVESHLPESGRILDFGCGYGMLSNYLALKNPRRSVFGIDLNPNRISVAQRSLKDNGDIIFKCGDIDDLEMAPFDAVVMTDVLHHISDSNIRLLMQKMRTLLKSDGSLVILDVDKSPLWKFFMTYTIDRLLNLNRSLHYRSASAMGFLLEELSFAIEKTIPADRGLPLADILYLCKKMPDHPMRHLVQI